MSDQSIQLSALISIRNKAESDVRRAERHLERAQNQVEAAKAKLRTLQETIDILTQTEPQPKSQKDQIRDVIKEKAGTGVTAQQIHARLMEMGVQFVAKNPTASIHVAADRLVEEGCVESSQSAEGKIYKWKSKPTSEVKSDVPRVIDPDEEDVPNDEET